MLAKYTYFLATKPNIFDIPYRLVPSIFSTSKNFLSSPLLGAACGEPEQEGGQRAGGSGPTWHRGGHCPRHTAVDSPYLRQEYSHNVNNHQEI
jgi:hypothetical protein